MWMNLYNNKFSAKHLYTALDPGVAVIFPRWVVRISWVPLKVNFFCVGGNLGKSYDSRLT